MEWLRFSSLAIGSFPTGVLMCVLTIFLLTIKKKSISTWMLVIYFGVLSILILSYVIRYSVLSTSMFHIGQVSNLIVFGIASYILFAYLFQGNYYPLESKILTSLFSIAALSVYISIFVKYPILGRTYDFEAHYFTYVYGVRVSVVTGLGFIWIIIIFFRKTVRTSEYSGSLSKNRITARLFIILVKMVRPVGKEAKTFQALALLTLGMFSISFMYLLMSAEIISRETYGFFFNSVGLLTSFSIFLLYTNSIFEPSSFRGKLIGVSLAPTMLILGILSSIILSDADASFDQKRRLEAENIKAMLVTGEASHIPGHVVYIVSRPEEGLFSSSYRIEYSSREDLRAPDFISNDRREKARKLSRDVQDIMKNNSIDDSAQVRTLVSTDIDRKTPPLLERRFRYFNLQDIDSFYIHYDFSYENRLYEIGYSYKWYRWVIHKTAVNLFYIILGSGIVILVLFPVFFYRNLFKIDLKIF